jgi:hypothetical protein
MKFFTGRVQIYGRKHNKTVLKCTARALQQSYYAQFAFLLRL